LNKITDQNARKHINEDDDKTNKNKNKAKFLQKENKEQGSGMKLSNKKYEKKIMKTYQHIIKARGIFLTKKKRKENKEEELK